MPDQTPSAQPQACVHTIMQFIREGNEGLDAAEQALQDQLSSALFQFFVVRLHSEPSPEQLEANIAFANACLIRVAGYAEIGMVCQHGYDMVLAILGSLSMALVDLYDTPPTSAAQLDAMVGDIATAGLS